MHAVVVALAACGCTGSNGSTTGDGGPSGTGGDGGAVVGTACTPASEDLPAFAGFNRMEVSLACVTGQPSGSPCCMTYEFQGRVTCPYGQDAQGAAPKGATACKTPDGIPVSGPVSPQCVERPAAKLVFWSCRCANENGRTDDGATYCTCPSGTSCAQTIKGVGAAENDLSGAYCRPAGVDPMDAGACTTCDPTSHPCP
jgi:hypothetical protein